MAQERKNSTFCAILCNDVIACFTFCQKSSLQLSGSDLRLRSHKEREHDILTGLDGIIVIPRPQIKLQFYSIHLTSPVVVHTVGKTAKLSWNNSRWILTWILTIEEIPEEGGKKSPDGITRCVIFESTSGI